MSQTTIVTTSWDDGHPCDARLAEALAKSGLPATFYVPLFGEDGKPVLGPAALRSFLKQGFEIGAHTVTHKVLISLDKEVLTREVCGSKQLMEDQLGEEVRMFCYPRTSLQAFPHPPLDYLKNLGKRGNLPGFARYISKYARCKSWVEMGKIMFDEAMREGGVWHIYGHSWELEDLGLWDQLQELFSYVANRPGVIYATNSKALELAAEAA